MPAQDLFMCGGERRVVGLGGGSGAGIVGMGHLSSACIPGIPSAFAVHIPAVSAPGGVSGHAAIPSV
jgi:hypothetical protein